MLAPFIQALPTPAILRAYRPLLPQPWLPARRSRFALRDVENLRRSITATDSAVGTDTAVTLTGIGVAKATNSAPSTAAASKLPIVDIPS